MNSKALKLVLFGDFNAKFYNNKVSFSQKYQTLKNE